MGMTTNGSSDFPHIGSHLSWTSQDGHTVTVTRLEHTWTVTTYRGLTYRVETMCSTHATEAEARNAARRYAIRIRAGAGGLIERGAPLSKSGLQTGRLTATQIDAAAKRRWVVVIRDDSPRRSITGCRPTPRRPEARQHHRQHPGRHGPDRSLRRHAMNVHDQLLLNLAAQTVCPGETLAEMERRLQDAATEALECEHRWHDGERCQRDAGHEGPCAYLITWNAR